MKAALFTGMFVLLLLAPAQTHALGLAEYDLEAAKADGPVLALPRLNSTLESLKDWQTGLAAGSFRETVSLLFRVSQFLLVATLLLGYGPGRRKFPVKARRIVQHHKPGAHGRGLLSPQ